MDYDLETFRVLLVPMSVIKPDPINGGVHHLVAYKVRRLWTRGERMLFFYVTCFHIGLSLLVNNLRVFRRIACALRNRDEFRRLAPVRNP